jgi:hypothetical protein
MALRLRRGTDAERLIVIPLQGELIYTTDTKKLYAGDGATAGGILVGPTEADGFTNLVDDTTPQLGGNLDLNGNNITGTGNIDIDGTITATGVVNLGDDDADIVNVSGVINSSLRPALDGEYNLGSSQRRWNTVWAEGGQITGQLTAESVFIDRIVSSASTLLYDSNTDTLSATNVDATTFTGALSGNVTGDLSGNVTSLGTSQFAQLEADSVTLSGGTIDGVTIGSDVNVPATNITGREITATIGFAGVLTGQLFGNSTGTHLGDVKGSVVADDSTLLVDGIEGKLTGDLTNNRITSSRVELNRLKLEGTDIQGDDVGLAIVSEKDNFTSNFDTFTITGYNDTNEGQVMSFIRHRGTQAAPSALQDGDIINALYWFGADADANPAVSVVAGAVVDGTPTSGVTPGAFQVVTWNTSGVPTVGLKIKNNGVIEVADNTVAAGANPGDVDDSAVVEYLQITVGGTSYAMPLYAIRP